MKHLKHFILALVLMASAMPAFAVTVSLDTITYELNTEDLTATLVNGSKRWGAVKLPSYITYYGKKHYVTAIADSAFMANTHITSINIPSQVSSIGNGAFFLCTKLHTIDFQNTVSGTIGEVAFAGCTSLKEANMPDCITSIGDGAFTLCTALTSVHLPSALTIISKEAFSHCSKLVSYNTPNTITEYGESCFYGCSSLKEIHIKSSTDKIGNHAFYECDSLERVYYNTRGYQKFPTEGQDIFSTTTHRNAILFYRYLSTTGGTFTLFTTKKNVTVKCGKSGLSISNYVYDENFSQDYDEMVFTLNNLNLNLKGYVQLPPTTCKLILKGNNTIVCNYDSIENNIGFGLSFSPYFAGIDSLIIEGPGSLSVSSLGGPIDGKKYNLYTSKGALISNGHLVIKNCTIEATGRIKCYDDVRKATLTIENSTVKATGNNFYDATTGEKTRTMASIGFFSDVKLKNCYLASPAGTKLAPYYYATEWCTYNDSGIVSDLVTILPGENPALSKGDVNGDGKVDTSDLSELISIILNNGTATDYPRADVNGDSKVDTTDISALMSIILGA